MYRLQTWQFSIIIRSFFCLQPIHDWGCAAPHHTSALQELDVKLSEDIFHLFYTGLHQQYTLLLFEQSRYSAPADLKAKVGLPTPGHVKVADECLLEQCRFIHVCNLYISPGVINS